MEIEICHTFIYFSIFLFLLFSVNIRLRLLDHQIFIFSILNFYLTFQKVITEYLSGT